MKSESTLPALALLDLLWIRGDETLAAELDEIGPWGTAIHEPGVVQHVERLRQLRASTPPLIVSADGVAATTARWLLLLDTGRDHELGSEVVRVQSDPVLAASAPVVWTLAHLHHPLPEPLGPDLHGIAHARVFFWTEREKSAGVHDGLRRVLSEGGERLDTCWKSALGRDPALREDRRDSIKLTVSQRSRVLENVVIEGTFAAPELEGCLRKAIEGKAVDAGDDGGDLTVTVRYEMGFRDFRPFEAQRIFANP